MASRPKTNGPEKAAQQLGAAEDGEKNKEKTKLTEEQLAVIRGDPVEREYFTLLPLMARCAQVFHQSRAETTKREQGRLLLRDGIATLGHAKGLGEATDDDRRSG